MRKKPYKWLHEWQASLLRIKGLIKQPIFIQITLWGHASVFLGAYIFYYLEKEANPKIDTYLDGVYWAIATVTTVGYGDIIPFTNNGKIVAAAMMIVGSLFLWTYTALFVGAILEKNIQEVETDVRDIEREVKLDSDTTKELLLEIRQLRAELKSRDDSK